MIVITITQTLVIQTIIAFAGENDNNDDSSNDSCCLCSRNDFYPTQNYMRRYRR